MNAYHAAPAHAPINDQRSWLTRHKWLILRRTSQLGILGLFLLGPLADIWWLKGNLGSSKFLDTVPMSDPFGVLQTFMAGHLPATSVVLGALLITAFYFVVGGRTFCAWVCPVNLVTDAADVCRDKLGIKKSTRLSRQLRYWVLAMALLAPLVTGAVLWELVNPVTLLQRGILFGLGLGWMVIVGIFLFDLFISRKGWCGHICPMGAFYSLIGHFSPVTVNANKRKACDDCMDCYAVCPEPLVIKPALKGEKKGLGPVINDANCTRCGRCIDVCSKEVFRFSHRFDERIIEVNEIQSSEALVKPSATGV